MLQGRTYSGELGSTRTYFGVGRWTVVVIEYTSKESGKMVRIMSLKNISPYRPHFEDFPIKIDGKIEYFHPEKIPAYAKKLVELVFEKLENV